GIFAVLIATPCTAPLLGPALGFAFTQPPLVILAIFSLTGLGLGLPFLLLGIWPGIIKKMPKPGNWMNSFKEVMGFLLFGTAIYLFTTFAKLAPSALNGALWWMLFLGFSAWLLGKARNPLAKLWFRRVGQIIALLIALGSGFLFIDLSRSEATQISQAGNSKYVIFDENDILSRIAADEAIFLEFTAAWCTTCKVNQRIFNDKSVRALMAEKGVTHIKGDLTAYDETLTRWLADFGRAGVPLYVIYRPGEEPVLLPELLSVDGFKKELEKISVLSGG
ncbi:MAG: thioredoxin family protein, partial [Spirochaetaceae bacterium]|nr:thioredoxin family protein [Spirochaetaceae bacterium]